MKIKRKSEDVYLDFKMKAGAPINILNNSIFKRVFLQKCAYISNGKNGNNFKVIYRKVLEDIDLILFGQNLLDYQSKYYLPYIYYLENEHVKFKQISIVGDSFTFQDITFEKLQEIYIKSGNQNKNLIELLFEKISTLSQNKGFSSGFSSEKNDIFWKLVNQLNRKIRMQQQYSPQQYPPQQYPPQQYPPQQYPPQQYPPQQYPPQQYPPQQYPPQQYPPQQYPPQQYPPQQYPPQQYPPQQYPPQQYPPQQYPPQQYPPQSQSQSKIVINPTNANKIKLQKLTQIQETLEKSIRNELQKKQIFNITKQNLTNKYSFYRCEDPSLEVNIQDNKIFFGYDENLFIESQDGSYKFYYKYSYHNGKFMQLTKNQNQNQTLEEKEIVDINLIPTYDILRLYFAVKDLPNRTELVNKLKLRINKAKDNISKTAEAFFNLGNSNFDKEIRNSKITNTTLEQKKITNIKQKNFGKVKKRRMTEKTYIFFGARQLPGNIRNHESKFGFVCFREDDKVFYYEKGKLNEKKPLSNFPFIYPLEDLIAFILLRRMITNDQKFADQIYNEATARIKFLKTQKIADKMLVKQFPEEYQSFQGQPLRATQQSQQQISLLPRSKNAINKAIQIFESF